MNWTVSFFASRGSLSVTVTFWASDGPPDPQFGVTVDCASASQPALLWTSSVYVSTGAGLPERNAPVLSSQRSARVSTITSAVTLLFVRSGSGVFDETVA